MTPTEIGIAIFVSLVAAWFAWALRRVKINDMHAIESKLDEMKRLNREDHQKFFDRLGKLETAVEVLKTKAGD